MPFRALSVLVLEVIVRDRIKPTGSTSPCILFG
jgi:hypothetical protein